MESSKITNLLSASRLGATQAILSLLKTGIDINSRNNATYTALSRAVSNNHYEAVKILLEHNADANLIYENKYNVLHIAASDIEIDPRIVEILIPKINDINEKDNPHQNTALWYACHFGYLNNYKIAEILLKHGADVNLVNAYGKTVIDMAEMRSEMPEIKRLIMKYTIQK
ncbi:hypothetical protein GVN20_06595 [Runella sp. CRIBMP]|uniref:ankyrin repeat domain-containing protein n=1 Tax=Runella sp. CRIBMP TaxID=2683261 RepID=UPI00141316B4|nr:ankyrin repeat domain-containing protein [Runella sp. CRIBMP]NBB19020.1 hypothetical protein [Runella sp. CRIBMP]